MFKKKSVYLIICFVFVVVCFVGALLYYQNTLIVGTMKNEILEAQSSTSEIGFIGQTDEDIKIKSSSHIKEGSLSIVLEDSDRTVIKEIPYTNPVDEEIKLEKDDKYFVSVVYQDFVGSFDVKITK